MLDYSSYCISLCLWIPKATEINEVKFDIYLQNGFLLPSSQLNFKLSFCSQVVNEDENEYQLSVCQLLC